MVRSHGENDYRGREREREREKKKVHCGRMGTIDCGEVIKTSHEVRACLCCPPPPSKEATWEVDDEPLCIPTRSTTNELNKKRSRFEDDHQPWEHFKSRALRKLDILLR